MLASVQEGSVAMPAKLIDFIAPVDVILFFGVPLVLMICVFVQESVKSRRRR